MKCRDNPVVEFRGGRLKARSCTSFVQIQQNPMQAPSYPNNNPGHREYKEEFPIERGISCHEILAYPGPTVCLRRTANHSYHRHFEGHTQPNETENSLRHILPGKQRIGLKHDSTLRIAYLANSPYHGT